MPFFEREDLGVVLVGHLVEDLVVSLKFLLLTLCLCLDILFHVFVSKEVDTG